MKFKVKKEQLVEGLQKCQGVCRTGHGAVSNPVLENVLFLAGDGTLELRGTDERITVCVRMDAETAEAGSTTLPPKRMLNIIRELDAEDVEVTVQNNLATLESGSFKSQICGVPDETFPKLPEMEGATEYKMDQGVLKGMLKMTSYAAAADPSRQLLSSVLLSFQNGRLSVVATDSRRLALVENDIEMTADQNADVIVPLAAVNEILKSLGDAGELTIRATKKLAQFDNGAMQVYTKLAEGMYPNFRQVVPQAAGDRATIGREALQTAIRRTTTFANDLSPAMNLTFDADTLEILVTTPEVGEARERLDVKYSGKPLSISFNPVFLTEPLKNLTQDEVYLDLVDDVSPGVLRTNISFVYVLMPIRR